MLYQLLRALAHIALRWYYADVVVQGGERIPSDGPLLIIANHPNALVDALMVATTLQRRVLLTARATLFEHPLLAPLLRLVGVVPLRRAADEHVATSSRDGVPVSRNADAFRAVREALRRRCAVMVFPEGISHDASSLAPLRTGAARMAFDARSAGVQRLLLLPVGLVFERKEEARSRVLVRIGQPIDFDRWCDVHAAADAHRLTADLQDALRQVTLNFASEASARRAVALARALAAIIDEPPQLNRPRPLATEVDIARRIEAATDALTDASPDLVAQAEQFIARVESLEHRLAAEHATMSDARISTRIRHGTLFVVREGLLAVLVSPLAILGRVTHWFPLHLARALAMRPLATDPSRDQPAMRMIVLGLALVLLWYLVQGVVIALWFGILPAILWIVAISLTAYVDLRYRDRRRRAVTRARTYLALRANPVLRTDALAEMASLRSDALVLEAALLGQFRRPIPTG